MIASSKYVPPLTRITSAVFAASLLVQACGGSSKDDTPNAECTVAAIENVEAYEVRSQWVFYRGALTPNIGEAAPDYFYFKFKTLPTGSRTPGTFELATGYNANRASCLECLSAEVDEDLASDTVRRFYPSQGSIALGEDPISLHLDVGLTGVTLREGTVDPETSEIIPVAGGACIQILEPFAVDHVAWTCDVEATYETGGNCDCGCGDLIDPDCLDFDEPPLAGCGNGQTCDGTGSCVAACDLFAPTPCASGTCVVREITSRISTDYCEQDSTLIDEAEIGELCVHQFVSKFCGVEGGIAKGVCAENGSEPQVCSRACRTWDPETQIDDCGAQELCLNLDGYETGYCVPFNTP